MPAPTIVEQVSANSGGVAVASLSVSTSSNPVAGDLLVAIHTNDFSTAANMSSPTGSWTLRATGDDGTDNAHVKAWTRTVVSPGTQTVTANQIVAAFTTLHVYVIRGHGGVDKAIGFNDTTDNTTHSLGSITAAESDELLIDGLSAKLEGTYTSGPGTKRSEQDVSPNHTGACYDRTVAAGAVGSRTATFSVVQASAASVSILIYGVNSSVRGTEFYVLSTRWFKSLWFWKGTSSTPNPSECALYRVFSPGSGVKVPNTHYALPTYSGTGWKEIVLTPVVLEVGVRYRACLLFPAQDFVSTAAYFTTGAGSAGITQGELVVPNKAGAVGTAQGCYAFSSTMIYPTQSDGSNYWVDVSLVDVPR